MPKKVIGKFQVEYLQIMDEHGTVDENLMPTLDKKEIQQMYKEMVIARVLDEKLLSLQRQGRAGTFAQVKGQEACQIGSIHAIKKEDWVVPAFREQAALLARGLPPELPILYYGGDSRGSVVPKDNNFLPVAIPVGTHILHAVGIAWAAKLKGDSIVVLNYFGDGATSTGDCQEAMNFAGVFKAPVIFLCQNNQWAISVPRKIQSAAATLAQKAIAYGFEGIQVDGNDVFAVYKATKEAAEKARAGKGPTLIECYTYRMGDHTTSDDASRYRSKEEVEYWKKRDPIDRLRKYMEKQKMWDAQEDAKLRVEVERTVNEAVERAEQMPALDILDIFQFTFAEMIPELQEQYAYLKEVVKE